MSETPDVPAFALTFAVEAKTNRLLVVARCGDTVLGTIALDAAGVDTLQKNLALARRHLAPPVPAELPVGPLNAVIDPVWWTEPHPSGGTVLALRHGGYGWLAFLLPPASREKLGKLLGAQSVAVAATPGKPN